MSFPAYDRERVYIPINVTYRSALDYYECIRIVATGEGKKCVIEVACAGWDDEK